MKCFYVVPLDIRIKLWQKNSARYLWRKNKSFFRGNHNRHCHCFRQTQTPRDKYFRYKYWFYNQIEFFHFCFFDITFLKYRFNQCCTNLPTWIFVCFVRSFVCHTLIRIYVKRETREKNHQKLLNDNDDGNLRINIWFHFFWENNIYNTSLGFAKEEEGIVFNNNVEWINWVEIVIHHHIKYYKSL